MELRPFRAKGNEQRANKMSTNFESPNSGQELPVGLIMASIICSILALGVVPPLFGGVAIYLAYRVQKKHTIAGNVCMVIGIVALIIGVISGAFWGMENLRF